MNSHRPGWPTLAALRPACVLAVCLASLGAGAVEVAPERDGGFEAEVDAGVAPAAADTALDGGGVATVVRRPEVLASPDGGAPSRVHVDALLTGLVEGVSPSANIAEVFAARVDARVEVLGPVWVGGTLATNLANAAATRASTLVARDTGSSLTAGFASPESPTGQVTLSVQPFGSTRQRPTFDWANAWGQVFNETAPAPTFVVQWLGRRASVWATLRLGSGYGLSARSESDRELRPGGLAGVSWWTENGWSLEARGAAFDRGYLPSFALQGAEVRTRAMGLTARLGWRYGGGVGPAWDQVTYRDDPERFEQLRTPVEEKGPFAAQVLLEAGYATQTLGSPDVFLATVQEPASFVDLQARLRVGPVRFYATGRAKTLSLITFDAPGLPPYTGTSRGAVASPALSALVGAEGRVAGWVVPGLLIRVQQPASLRMVGSPTALVVRGMDLYWKLFDGGAALPTVTATANVRLGPVRDVFFVAGLDLGFDLMSAVFRPGTPARQPLTGLPAPTLTASLLVQARFR